MCFSLLLINLPWSIFNTIKGYADVMKTLKLHKYHFPVSNIGLSLLLISVQCIRYCYNWNHASLLFNTFMMGMYENRKIWHAMNYCNLHCNFEYIIHLCQVIMYTIIQKMSIGMDCILYVYIKMPRIKEWKTNYYELNRVYNFYETFFDIGSGISKFSNYISQRVHWQMHNFFFINK